MRRDLEDPVDQAGAAPRNLLELPPVLHGPQKLIDTEGRVERFTKKFGAQTSESRKKAAKASKKPAAGDQVLRRVDGTRPIIAASS